MFEIFGWTSGPRFTGFSSIHHVIDTIQLASPKPTLSESFLKEKYLKEGLSSKEIAKLAFSSRATVTNYLNKYGIPLKKVTRRTNGGHRFGFRRYGGRSILMKKEQEVMEMIKLYRFQGYSYQKIADILNNQKIQTKTKNGFWYSKVVRQIFLRHLRSNESFYGIQS